MGKLIHEEGIRMWSTHWFDYTLVKCLIGTVMEKLFHATWLDYSEKPFNIKDRVCLPRDLMKN